MGKILFICIIGGLIYWVQAHPESEMAQSVNHAVEGAQNQWYIMSAKAHAALANLKFHR